MLLLACLPWLAEQAHAQATQSISIEANHDSLPLPWTDADGTLEFTLTRTGDIANALDVEVTLNQQRVWLLASRLTQNVSFAAGASEASFALTRSWFWQDHDDSALTGVLAATIVTGDDYTVSGGSAEVFILGRNQPLGLISLDSAEYEFSEESADQPVHVEVRLAAGLTPSALANWIVSVSTRAGDANDSGASSTEDYVALSSTENIGADDYRKQDDRWIARVPVRVDIVDDEIFEPDESFSLLLEQAPGFDAFVFRICTPSGETFTCSSSPQEYPATIAESDRPEQPFLRLDRKILLEADDLETDVDENSVRLTAGFRLGGVFDEDQTITLRFGGDAGMNADYTVSPSDADADSANGYQVTLPAGGRSTEVTLTAVADLVESEAETIEITATLDFDNSTIGTATVEVYEDSASSDDDATLRKLRLTAGRENIQLHGGFRGYVTSYTAVANRIVDRVRVETVLNSEFATVSIAGDDDPASARSAEIDLEFGQNTIEVVVTAGSGDTTTYQVILTRLEELPVVTIEPVHDEVEEGETVDFRIRLAERWPANVDIDVRGFDSGMNSRLISNPNLRVNYLGTRDPVMVRSLKVENNDWPEDDGAISAQILPRPGHYEIGVSGAATVRILDDDAGTMRKPDIPQLFEAIPGDSKATLAWEPPRRNGGSPVTHYEYRVEHQSSSTKPGETDGEWVSTGGLDTSLVLTGLENNNYSYDNLYQFELRAVNRLGASQAATAAARPWPRTVKPGAPRNFSAEADGNGGIILRWDPPAADGGSALIRYDFIAEHHNYRGNSWSGEWASTGGVDTEITVTEWYGRYDEDHISYFFRVRAINAAGYGNFSTGAWASPAGVGGVSSQASHSIPEPLHITVADASSQEAPAAQLAFEVTLDRVADEAVSVRYATYDGTATAGEDYEFTSGLLRFAPGEQSADVRVAVLDDAHDESSETMTLILTDADGGLLADSSATGTINNSDPMPKAWLARFGRAASDQTAQAIGRRLEQGSRASHLTLGGLRVDDLFQRTRGNSRTSGLGTPVRPNDWMNSSFFYSDTVGEVGAGQWSAWGETAANRFEGEDGPLSLNGKVATAIMGLDSQRGNWLAGIAVSHSQGDGAYAHDTAGGGNVASSLTSVNPYAHYRLDERTSFWGTLGYGKGSLELAPSNSESLLAAGLSNAMAAFGGRSVLTALVGETGDFELAVRSDALLTSTRSDSIEGLIGTEAATSRARLLLEGSGKLPLSNGGLLRSSLEAGLRHDAGDAETGTGFEIGGGLAYERGRLAVQVDARTLVAHQSDAYREWGASISLRYQPSADGRGLVLHLGSGWGKTRSGMQDLWEMQDAGVLTGAGPANSRGRLRMELGYGTGQNRLWYPYVAAERAGNGGQALRLGLKLNAGPAMDAGLEIGRRESGPGIIEEAVMVQGRLQW